MEVWMLLAAAGSGYLAKCWHQAQKLKSINRAHEEDEDDHPLRHYPDGKQPPDEQLPALSSNARQESRHISSPDRTHPAKLICKGNWGLSRRQALKPVSLEQGFVSQERDIKEATRGAAGSEHNNSMAKTIWKHEEAKMECQRNYTIVDTRLAAEELSPSNNAKRNETIAPSSSLQNEFVLANQGNDTFSTGFVDMVNQSNLKLNFTREADARTGDKSLDKWPLNCEGRLLTDKGSSFQVGKVSLDGESLNSPVEETGFRNEQSLSNVGRGKCLNDALDNLCHVEEQMLNKDESVFRIQSSKEFKFQYDALSFPMQQGETKIRGSSLRRSRTPNKFGRCRSSITRGKTLITTCKPMSSLESCLSAQLNQQNESIGCMRISHQFLPISAENLYHKPAFHAGQDLESSCGPLLKTKNLSTTNYSSVTLRDTDCIVSLPALSKSCRNKSYVNKKRSILERFSNNAFSSSKNNNLALKDTEVCECTSGRSGEYECQRRAVAHFQTDFTLEHQLQGFSHHSNEELLFKFGVGFGMLFMIMFNKEGARKHADLNSEMQGPFNQLGDETSGRERVSSNGNKHADLQALKLSDHHVDMTNDEKIRDYSRSVSSMMSGMKSSLSHDNCYIEHEPRQQNDMAMLEAELEAELERMEFNLNEPKSFNHQRSISSVSEADLDTVIDGELTASNLPCDVELSSDDGSSPPIPEEVQMIEYAVSPVELERRLHEVLEARQEEHIRELEAELGSICNILETKERELRWWKNQVSYCVPADGRVSPVLLINKDSRSSNCEGLVNKSVQLMAESRTEQDVLHFPCYEDYEGNIDPMLQDTHLSFGPNNSFYLRSVQMDIKREIKPSAERAVAFSTVSDISKDTDDNSPLISTLAGDAKIDYSECNKILYALDNSKMSVNPISKRHEKQIDSFFVAKYSVEDGSTSTSQEEFNLNVSALAGRSCNSSEQLVPEISTYIPETLDSQLIKSPSSDVAIEDQFLAQEVISYYPELESGVFSDFGNLVGMADDSAFNTSASSPCSVKCVDASILHWQQPDSYSSGMQNLEICPNVNNSSLSFQGPRETAQSKVMVGNNQHRRILDEESIVSKKTLQSSKCSIQFNNLASIDFGNREDQIAVGEELAAIILEEDNSDWDEQLGKLLIKQIVEKTRQGSPILQEVQTVLASLETDEDTN